MSERLRLRAEVGKVFNPAAPVEQKALFAGRLEQVNSVVDAISQRGQHAIIYGERGVGKTSLANVLQEFLASAGQRVLVLRFNGEESASYTTVWKKMFADLEATVQTREAGFIGGERTEAVRIVNSLPKKMSPDDVRRVLAAFGSRTVLILTRHSRNQKGSVAEREWSLELEHGRT